MSQKPILHQMGVAELATAIADKKTSAVEAAQALLGRAKQHAEPGRLSGLQRRPDPGTGESRRCAHRRRRAWPAAGRAAWRTRTSSSPRASPPPPDPRCWRATRAPFDATVVANLAEAGAVTLGKLNCDEFAMGSAATKTRPIPAVGHSNPWDTDRPRARRLLGRLGRRRGRPPGAGRHRHRHRRLDPPACKLLRPHRHQAHLRPLLALRHDRLRLQPGPGRPDGAQRRRLRHAAQRPWSARTSTATPPAWTTRPRTTRACWGPRAKALPLAATQGPAHRAAQGVLRRRLRARCARIAVRAALKRIREARRHAGRHLAAAHRAVHPGLLHHRAGRGLVEPEPF